MKRTIKLFYEPPKTEVLEISPSDIIAASTPMESAIFVFNEPFSKEETW